MNTTDVKEVQLRTLLKYLKTGKKISQKKAIQFGIYRLSARIFDLKDKGHKIDRELDKHGFAHYYLIKK